MEDKIELDPGGFVAQRATAIPLIAFIILAVFGISLLFKHCQEIDRRAAIVNPDASIQSE